jgi:hypothetical protein
VWYCLRPALCPSSFFPILVVHGKTNISTKTIVGAERERAAVLVYSLASASWCVQWDPDQRRDAANSSHDRGSLSLRIHRFCWLAVSLCCRLAVFRGIVSCGSGHCAAVKGSRRRGLRGHGDRGVGLKLETVNLHSHRSYVSKRHVLVVRRKSSAGIVELSGVCPSLLSRPSLTLLCDRQRLHNARGGPVMKRPTSRTDDGVRGWCSLGR